MLQKKRMTILYPVIHYPPVIGGVEQWAKNIAIRQGKDKEIIIVTGKVKGEPNEEHKNNVKVFRTSLFSLSNLSYSSWAYITTAVPFVLYKSIYISFKNKVSLIHCHGFLSAIIGYFISLIFGIPYLGTEQSTGWSGSKSRILRSFVYKRAKICVASSNVVTDEFKGIGIKNVAVIPNGVDLALFKDTARAHKKNLPPYGRPPVGRTFQILSVGRLEDVKGHKYLIEAFSEIKKEMPDARLTIAGDGRERQSLESQVLNLGVSGSVQFVGEVQHEKLPDLFVNADIFVMPSLAEGFGITAIEAMAFGIPVIATKIGGLTDIIEDGKDGILVNPRDINAIKEAVCELRKNPEKAKFFSENAKKKVENFSWDKIAEKVSQLYAEIVPDASALKILILTSILPPDIGGPAIYAEKLTDEFMDMGMKVDVALARKPGFIWNSFGKLKSADIIYALSSSPKVLVPAFIIAKLLKRKFAVRIGGDYLWERAAEHRGITISIREFYASYKKSVKEKIVFLVLKSILYNSDTVIFTTFFQQKLYAKHFNLRSERSKVIENPFPRVNHNTEMGFPREPLVILYGGRLIKLKNLEMLIFALKEAREHAKKEIMLKIIGGGPQKTNLENVVAKMGLKDSVLFVQSVSNEDLLKELNSAWLAILPSFSEISPNFALEAISCGIPVIITRETGLANNITKNLLMFDPHSENELTSLINKMLEPDAWLEYKRRILDIDTDRGFSDVALEHKNIFSQL